MPTQKSKKKPASGNKFPIKNHAKSDCYFLANIDRLGAALKELVTDYNTFSEVQKEQKNVAQDQALQMKALNVNLGAITNKLESSFELGKAFIKLFRLLLLTMLFVVLSFASIIVYITNIDINSEFLSFTNRANADTNEPSDK